jgi:hypothetical protein
MQNIPVDQLRECRFHLLALRHRQIKLRSFANLAPIRQRVTLTDNHLTRNGSVEKCSTAEKSGAYLNAGFGFLGY